MILIRHQNCKVQIAWQLQGSKPCSFTVEGTLGSIYFLIAMTALWPSMRISKASGEHLPDLLPGSEHLTQLWGASNVKHSSEIILLRTWHVNSTKLFAELNPVILTLLSLWCCSSCICYKNWNILHVSLPYLWYKRTELSHVSTIDTNIIVVRMATHI